MSLITVRRGLCANTHNLLPHLTFSDSPKLGHMVSRDSEKKVKKAQKRLTEVTETHRQIQPESQSQTDSIKGSQTSRKNFEMWYSCSAHPSSFTFLLTSGQEGSLQYPHLLFENNVSLN